ncbi:hypothetical protein F383_12183 [Gossypium arboreum]|uniref:Uncharacterized protein n=1 Tax=Gossypium arboreum TaxID=29729 RepID=A0A0B0PQT7_GOSAR|nr:hypothetical protein F383_12183 [Gossypium arboreum]
MIDLGYKHINMFFFSPQFN